MTWKRLSFQHAQLAGKAYAGFATEQPKVMPSAPQLSGQCKRISSAVHFYQNRNLEAYASRPATRMTLRQLVRGHFFAREAWAEKCAGILWKIYERGAFDQGTSSGWGSYDVALYACFAERKLCPDRAPYTNRAQTSRHASAPLRSCDARGCSEGIRGEFAQGFCVGSGLKADGGDL